MIDLILICTNEIMSNVGDLVFNSLGNNLGQAVQQIGGIGVGASVGFGVLKKAARVVENSFFPMDSTSTGNDDYYDPEYEAYKHKKEAHESYLKHKDDIKFDEDDFPF